MFDGANLYEAARFVASPVTYAGIGRGTQAPDEALVRQTIAQFKAMEQGVSRELQALIRFLNANYAADAFNEIDFEVVRSLAGSCVTGCEIAAIEPGSQAHEPGLQAA